MPSDETPQTLALSDENEWPYADISFTCLSSLTRNCFAGEKRNQSSDQQTALSEELQVKIFYPEGREKHLHYQLFNIFDD